MNEKLMVEVFAANPSAFNDCMDCDIIWREDPSAYFAHRQKAVMHLDEQKAHEYLNVASWIVNMQQQYETQIHIRIIDVVSLEGMAKSSQYGINAYPAVVIDHRFVYNAHTLDEASEQIARILNRTTEFS